VRAQTKALSPLLELAEPGATNIPTVAEVTFEGVDGAGHPVSVTGFITVNFANWADPDDGGGGE
jgi:hypothetical protein